MKTAILACQTIKDEIEKAYSLAGCDHDIFWVESGLHNNPDKLRVRLQEELDKITDVDRVILGFGFCGNSVLGLVAGNYELIIPKVDDCITLVIGSVEARNAISAEAATYFLTQGWLTHESNIWKEYQYSLKKYGKKKTAMIYDMMLGHYKRLGVIDTGCYDFEEFFNNTVEIAKTFKLNHERLDGTITYISELLTGPWDDSRYLIIAPGETITHEMINTFGFTPTVQS